MLRAHRSSHERQLASESATAEHGSVANVQDMGLVLIHGFIIFFMQAGFIMVEAGHGRAKNIINTCLKNVVDILLSCLAWWAVGFAFAYGGSSNAFIGTSEFFHAGEAETQKPWFFSWMFALCCVTIVSGCMTERTQLLAYPVLTLLVTLLIHPVAVHWVWSDGGWLRSVHAGVYFLDFAGCTLVHMIGGVVGLVGAVCVGPRMGRFEECGSVKELRGHDMSSISMGTLMLWFGWFGFNVGSCYLYENPNMQVLNRVALNMTLTASSAGCIALLLGHWLGKGTFDLRVCCNGLLSGLVVSTGLAGFCTPWASCVGGVLAGLLYTLTTRLLLRLRVDDPMDNAAVHLGGGALGTVLVGFLARPAYVEQLTGSLGSGVVYGSSLAGTQLGIQLLGLLVICLWAAVPALVVFKGLARCGLLRVDQAAELAGIDTFDHGGPGFPEFVGPMANRPSV